MLLNKRCDKMEVAIQQMLLLNESCGETNIIKQKLWWTESCN